MSAEISEHLLDAAWTVKLRQRYLQNQEAAEYNWKRAAERWSIAGAQRAKAQAEEMHVAALTLLLQWCRLQVAGRLEADECWEWLEAQGLPAEQVLEKYRDHPCATYWRWWYKTRGMPAGKSEHVWKEAGKSSHV